MNYCQRHNTCKKLASLNAAKSAGVAAIMHYNLNINELVMGVGKERGGPYQGQYNLCAGKGEQTDNCGQGFCWLMCAKREFLEEFKFDASFSSGNFDKFFKSSSGKIRVTMHQRTPIFVARLPAGTSRKTIKQQMLFDNNNNSLPHSHKEMDDFEWIRLGSGSQLEGNYINVTRFANAVRMKIDITRL